MGDPVASNTLAFVYEEHSGEEGVDPVRVFDFFMKRANENDADAQYQVFLSYEFGTGVEKNDELADGWLRKVADNGNANALSICVFLEMVSGNVEVGVDYWEKASAKGNVKAMKSLADIYL